MGGGFLPCRRAEAGVDAAWFGVAGLGGSATGGAVLEGLRDRWLGLPLEGFVEQFAAEGIAELHHQLLKSGEGRAPGRPLRPVEVVQQVFRRREEDRTQMGRNFYGTCLCCHREL